MPVTDAIGQTFDTSVPAGRIISLFPSQTHLLWFLGLDNEVLGITRFCKYPPEWKKTKTVIGGTKNVKADRIASLKPGLILANKEENTKEIVEELQKIAPVYVSEVITWSDNLKFIADTGKLTGRTVEAGNLIARLEARKKAFEKNMSRPRKTAVYFIWKNPWMTVGKNTFIDTMLAMAGFDNIGTRKNQRYPSWNTDELRRLNPQTVLLSSEPYPFKPEKHQDEIRNIFPDAELLFVKGEPFTWFGAYPLNAFDYFEKLIKP
jgi:ABC-type Fe3+-hydroxamate transport system substrate-binding protein